jgi:hypothetical protein
LPLVVGAEDRSVRGIGAALDSYKSHPASLYSGLARLVSIEDACYPLEAYFEFEFFFDHGRIKDRFSDQVEIDRPLFSFLLRSSSGKGLVLIRWEHTSQEGPVVEKPTSKEDLTLISATCFYLGDEANRGNMFVKTICDGAPAVMRQLFAVTAEWEEDKPFSISRKFTSSDGAPPGAPDPKKCDAFFSAVCRKRTMPMKYEIALKISGAGCDDVYIREIVELNRLPSFAVVKRQESDYLLVLYFRKVMATQ